MMVIATTKESLPMSPETDQRSGPSRHALSQLVDSVQLYFDALYYCDPDMLNRVFHSASSLFDVDQGMLFVEPIESFSADVGGRVSPASVAQVREDEILSIDFLSPAAATVKVRLRAHRNVFVDHLGFVLTEHGWQIVSKIWHLEKELNNVE